jgi:hypothetical protein
MARDDDVFEAIAEASPPPLDAPSTLKSRIYSQLVLLQAEQGPLMSLSECRRAGGELCVFEHLVAIAPLGEAVKSFNPCRVCHARILGERIENAPIWWPGCPYVRFQNR